MKPGILYHWQGKLQEAEDLLKQALALSDKLGFASPDTILDTLVRIYNSQVRHKEAKPLAERSLALREANLGPNHPNVATSLDSLATIYMATGESMKARSLLERETSIFENTY